jgi:MFS family permease
LFEGVRWATVDLSQTDEEGPEGEYAVPTIVASLIAGVFFGGVGGGVAFPTLPTLSAVLGLSPLVVGVILSANRFTRLVMSTPAGQFIDRYGARKPMIVGFLLQGTPPFGYVLGLHPGYVPFLGSAEIFVVSRVMWGVGAAFVFVGAYSTVVHVTTQANRGKWIGYFRGGQSLGFPTGLILGGVLTDVYTYETAFATAGVLGLTAMVVAAVVIPEIQLSVDEPARLRDVPRIVRDDPRIFVIGTVNFTTRMLFAGILLTTIVLYAEQYGIRIASFSAVGASGMIMGLSIFSASLTTVLAGRLSDRLDNRILVTLPSLGAFALGFVLLSVVPTLPATLVAVASIGIGVGGTNPPLLAYLGDISPGEDTGKIGGVYNAFGDVGSTIGPLIALPMAETLGYRTGYLLCAVVVVLVLAFLGQTLVRGAASGRTGTPE